MSGDYISREAAIERATRDLFDGQTADYVAADIKEKLNAVPTADVVEVVHSEWDLVDNEQYAICLSCECCIPMVWSDDEVHWNYCPNCGAKMDGKSADYAPKMPYDLLYEEGGPDA